VGCFQYSPVQGASANDLPDPVPEEVKEERWHRFMQAQADISEQKLADKVGKVMQVLIDEIDNNDYVARSAADAPEIDGNVFVSSDRSLAAGDIVTVKIDSAAEYDLWGTVVNQ
jgi:ribosomal protein S12 methylthiotransferase